MEGGAGCGSTTPPGCVNEKERGQEESAGSTTEVLTEGIEGLRLHLFRPSTLPAGPPPEPQPSPGICDGGRGPVPPPAPRSQLFLWLQRERRGNAGGSICRGLAAASAARLGKGGCWAFTAQPRGSHSGRAQRGTSHVTCQLVRLSPTVNRD